MWFKRVTAAGCNQSEVSAIARMRPPESNKIVEPSDDSEVPKLVERRMCTKCLVVATVVELVGTVVRG